MERGAWQTEEGSTPRQKEEEGNFKSKEGGRSNCMMSLYLSF
jgi:hypothetical protein